MGTQTKPNRVARLSTQTLHIIKLSGFDSLCGISSLKFRHGFEWDGRIGCKKCLQAFKKNEGANGN